VSATNGAAVVPLAPRLQGGRPKGSRNKLGEHFIAALCADFERHGVDVITRVREDDPAVYLRVIAQVVPQTVLMQDAKLDELSDDELAAYLFAVREALGGREGASGGAGAAGGDEPAEPLSPVSEAEGVS
jgi:hypothetical protein